MDLVVIGAFECSEKAPFPSHFPPILAERSSQGFRRVFYDSSLNVVELPNEAQWELKSNDILKNLSVIRTDPIPYSPRDQVVYLGNGKLIVTSKKIRIVLWVLPHLFSRRFWRALQSILNVYS